MADAKKPSTADYVETWVVCVIVGILVIALVEHAFGESWLWAGIRGAILAAFMATIVIVYHAWKRRAGSK